MARQTWVLTDVDGDVADHAISITNKDMSSASGSWKVKKSILRGGLSDGVELVEIDNGRMRLLVLPTRGMSIWKVDYKTDQGDQTLGWQSPVRGPVHPKFVPLFEPSGLGWLEGFDEFLVRCGLESNGAPEFNEQGQLVYPLHGRVGNRPAHYVDVTVDDAEDTISLRGIVEETRFHFQKLRLETTITMSLDSTSFQVSDCVENFGGTSAEMQMLYHINIGEPLLSPGDRLVAPVESIFDRDNPEVKEIDAWDVYGPPVAGQPEDCYFLKLLADDQGRAEVLLKNEAGTSGTSISYDATTLPYFTLWKNMVASQDGYVTGLEPGTNYPNTRTEEQKNGRVVTLAPGESWSTDLQIEACLCGEALQEVEQRIVRLGKKT